MRVYCRGFNLYNQLNGLDNCLTEFQPTIETAVVDSLEIKHSFSLLLSGNKINIFCEFATAGTIEYKNIRIKKISANDNVILIITDENILYKSTIDNLFEIEALPKFIQSNDKIKHISCGSKINVAYTETGLLYMIPTKLDFQNLEIVVIRTGQEHCILLDRLGNVYTLGRGSRGQLGHGQLDDETNPRLVEALAGIKIVDVAAGGWHSAAVSQEGDLYTWGWNGNGQLGLLNAKTDTQEKTVSVMATPHVVDINGSLDNQITQVACGRKHTIAMLDNNTLYGCGWNKYKQLKNDEQENHHSFIFLHDFSNECVQSITCGPWNSAVICK